MNASSCPNTRELLDFERQTAKNAINALNDALRLSKKPWCRIRYYEKDKTCGVFEGKKSWYMCILTVDYTSIRCFSPPTLIIT